MTWQGFLIKSRQPPGVEVPFWMQVKCLKFFIKRFISGSLVVLIGVLINVYFY